MNFNKPLELTEVFRVPNPTLPNGKPVEYAARISILWEDIKAIAEYPYPDDWETYKGEKYTVLFNYPQKESALILGSRATIIEYWTEFREKYPLFIEYGMAKDK